MRGRLQGLQPLGLGKGREGSKGGGNTSAAKQILLTWGTCSSWPIFCHIPFYKPAAFSSPAPMPWCPTAVTRGQAVNMRRALENAWLWLHRNNPTSFATAAWWLEGYPEIKGAVLGVQR